MSEVKDVVVCPEVECPECGSDNTKEVYDDGPHCEWEYAGRKCVSCGTLFDND